MKYDDILRKTALEEGACLFGVADASKMNAAHADSFPYAVSIAAGLSRAVLDEIDQHPTKSYFHHYRMVNMFLDQIAVKLTFKIQNEGYDAYPVPASQIVDWENQRGHLSHKEAAELAGLGWIGRNNLLVTPQFGSQVRLTTVLTDIPLTPAGPSAADCGECSACVRVCPANAIKKDRFEFDHMTCYEQLRDFQRKKYVGQYICGICVKACEGRGTRRNGT